MPTIDTQAPAIGTLDRNKNTAKSEDEKMVGVRTSSSEYLPKNHLSLLDVVASQSLSSENERSRRRVEDESVPDFFTIDSQQSLESQSPSQSPSKSYQEDEFSDDESQGSVSRTHNRANSIDESPEVRFMSGMNIMCDY